MKNQILLRRFAATAICVALFGHAVYAAPVYASKSETPNSNIATTQQVKTVTTGTVTANILNVRQSPGTDKPIVGKLSCGQNILVGQEQDNWYFIATSQVSGWVSGEYLTNITTMTEEQYNANQQATQANAANMITFAKQYLGKPYARGANGPNAFDCSGFVKYVYNHFGVNVPRSSRDYASFGTAVALSDIREGDILCFNTGGGGISHVGIYTGGGQLIHASTGVRGVVMDSIYDAYYSKRLVRIVRVM